MTDPSLGRKDSQQSDEYDDKLSHSVSTADASGKVIE